MNLSRRHLFGLFAGAAASSLLGKVITPVPLPDPPISPVTLADLLEARIAAAEEAMKANIANSLYGDYAARSNVGLAALVGDIEFTADDDPPTTYSGYETLTIGTPDWHRGLTMDDVRFAATYDWKTAAASITVEREA